MIDSSILNFYSSFARANLFVVEICRSFAGNLYVIRDWFNRENTDIDIDGFNRENN
jgi:hypothetical protein